MELAYPQPDLTDGAVLLRRWEEADVSLAREAAADEYTAVVERLPPPGDDEQLREWVAAQIALADGRLRLVIVDHATSKPVGAITLSPRHPPGAAEPGIFVVPRCRGRGFAVAATRLLARWALTHGGVRRVFATVEPWNTASERTLQSAAFVKEGLLRGYASYGGEERDVLMYSLLKRDLESS